MRLRVQRPRNIKKDPAAVDEMRYALYEFHPSSLGIAGTSDRGFPRSKSISGAVAMDLTRTQF